MQRSLFRSRSFDLSEKKTQQLLLRLKEGEMVGLVSVKLVKLGDSQNTGHLGVPKIFIFFVEFARFLGRNGFIYLQIRYV